MYVPQTDNCNRQRFLLFALIVAAASLGAPASAQVRPGELGYAIVRVLVTNSSGQGKSATGFLWLSENQVVTSLHAVLHARQPGNIIQVTCDGIPTKAQVTRVLMKADLVLLTPESPISGCRVFRDRFNGISAASLKPPNLSRLSTNGWQGSIAQSLYRELRKVPVGRDLPRETLNDVVDNTATLAALRQLRMPSTQIDIYVVDGDIFPGYSGAPAVNSDGRLIGIVSGGLDNGLKETNWLIPAVFLEELQASSDSNIPAVSMDLVNSHFASSIVGPSATQSSIVFEPRGDGRPFPPQLEPDPDEPRYVFTLTKTRSLAELASTSDSPDQLRQLVRAYGPAVGANAESRLIFDIYRELDRGLIIAVPAGQGLADGPLPEYPDIRLLRSEASSPGDGFIQYRELVPDAEGYQEVATGADGEQYFPRDAGYFDAYVDEELRDCRSWGDYDCRLDAPARHVDAFADGSKVLNFGIHVGSNSADEPSYYDYFSVAVREDVAFTAYSRIAIWEGEEGLFQCLHASPRCRDVSSAQTQLSQLVAAQLTTFDAGRPQPPMFLGVD